MTSAVDLLDKHWAEFVGKPMDEVTKHHLYYCIEAIQEAQKEAYNEAITSASKMVFSNERPDLAQQHRNHILMLIMP